MEEENISRTYRLTSGEILMNSRDHNFRFGLRTSSRKVINKPHGCGRLATSRSRRTLSEQERTHPGIEIDFRILPNDLFLQSFRIGFGKEIQECVAEIMRMRIRIAQMISHGIQEDVTTLCIEINGQVLKDVHVR